ncbi:MAG: tRNA lysidine(34) synthetase TilS [Actinomycetota bacterium]|nr:tRNA lysidine(34) synthetase TilS [Actinomycetota bacterium]
MMGPHPAVAEIRSAVRRMLGDLDGNVLVACSGGADSVALMAAVAFEAPRVGVRAGVVTVDHGLQEGSAEQAARVAALGYEMGLDPVQTVVVAVQRAGGPEGAARAARYGALRGAADALGASILLGHTLDDQAETVLLGLGRGSGPRSIAGMRVIDDRFARPLLGIRRTTTRAACAALGLAVWDDPHNLDPSYQRVRLRVEVLPLLEDVLQGGVAEALARTATLLRADLEALDALAAGFAFDGVLVAAELAAMAPAVRHRVLRAWARRGGAGALTYDHLAALDGLVAHWRGQGPIDLPGGRRVARASGRLEITSDDS